jgi:hypothetical protein
MFCAYCGEKLGDDANFCTSCGNRARIGTHGLTPDGRIPILIKRTTGHAFKLRAYKVILDGNEIGELGNGELKRFMIPEGKHTLHLEIDWLTSEVIPFDIADKTITFECGTHDSSASSTSPKTNQYIWIKII